MFEDDDIYAYRINNLCKKAQGLWPELTDVAFSQLLVAVNNGNDLSASRLVDEMTVVLNERFHHTGKQL